MSNNIPKQLIDDITFIGSFPNVNQAPARGIPEFAFIGRSNVGKSSLINYICDRRHLAKTSSTPGKTQLINLFNIGDRWMLADLPGYGYARISKKKRAQWKKMIETYLLTREELITVFLLLDIRHDPQKLDIQQMQWLASHGVPFSLVFTKSDKLKPAQIEDKRATYLLQLKDFFDPLPNHFVTSATSRVGHEELLDYIRFVIDYAE